MDIMAKINSTQKTLWETAAVYALIFILLIILSLFGGSYWAPFYFLPILCLSVIFKAKDKRLFDVSLLFFQIIALILVFQYIPQTSNFDDERSLREWMLQIAKIDGALNIKSYDKTILSTSIIWVMVILPIVEFIAFMLMKRRKAIEMLLMFLHIIFLYLLLSFIFVMGDYSYVTDFLCSNIDLIIIFTGLINMLVFKNINGKIEKYMTIIGIDCILSVILLLNYSTIAILY
ncbi:MAG: hypothetical protein LBC07_01270 [Elusimicrobiota bacterium]|jgi:hypothetical protein|nr:hypothetical protein [Elusimicrobiota bacterium]